MMDVRFSISFGGDAATRLGDLTHPLCGSRREPSADRHLDSSVPVQSLPATSLVKMGGGGGGDEKASRDTWPLTSERIAWVVFDGRHWML